MLTFKKSVAAVGRVLSSRLFGTAALAVVCSVVIATVAFGTNTVVINDEGAAYTVSTLSSSAEDILDIAQVELGYSDDIRFDGISGRYGEIDITRCVRVAVSDGGKVRRDTFDKGATVGEALESFGIVLGEYDELNYPVDTVLKDGMYVRVTRVEKRTRTVTEEIAFETVYTETDSLTEGESEITQAGVNGTRTYVYEDTVVDGVVTSNRLLSDEVTTPVTDEVVSVGTAAPEPEYALVSYGEGTVSALSRSGGVRLDENGVPVSYSAVYTGDGTAYTADSGAVTASGRYAAVGYVAVDPAVIPYGTELYIVSLDGSADYGYCIAADTGGFVGSSVICDLFMDSYDSCILFGNRPVAIYVLN